MDIRSAYAGILMGIMGIAGKDVSKKFDTRFRFHKKVNLKTPETLRDKVIYIENNCQSPIAGFCTDKWDVRTYVSEKGFADILVPVYGGAYRSFEEIPFDIFPDKFVLKATHGCKMNYFCTDKRALDLAHCKKTVTKWLRTTYGTYSGEWHYINIPHRIYCEQYLDDADEIIDYKFHCLNGVPQFVLACSERKSVAGKAMQATLDLFDMNWDPINELIPSGLERPGDGSIARPEHFMQMAGIAKKLSEDFKFVRVDLYELNHKVYFGELTFTPAAGVFPNYTEAFLRKMGEKLIL